MIFFLGVHRPNWLALTDVPLFVSRRTLHTRRALPRARGLWALDSGGFTELSTHGRWTVSPRDYAREVRRFRDEIGGLQWAAPQDWMCEAVMLRRTGLTIAEHQRRTVDNLLELRTIAPDLPWTPVLQGWGSGEYLDCWELYHKAGVDLAREPLVGLGTVCRRQNTAGAQRIVVNLATDGLRLHGFGFKRSGLEGCGQWLASADSMAWSYHARREPPMPGHESRHMNCANCLDFALEWRAQTIAQVGRRRGQLSLPGTEAA